MPGASETAPLPRVREASPSRGPSRMLQAAGLVAVAVVAGLVWYLVRQDNGVAGQAGPAAENPLTSGEFDYTKAAGPEVSADCAGNSYDDVADWFAEHPCEGVARALYTTQSGEVQTLVSVVVVTMSSKGDAEQLKMITDTEGTGNVNDLIRDGTADLPNAPEVAGGEYASRVEGRKLTIVESAFYADHTDDELLARIAKDALHLSAALS